MNTLKLYKRVFIYILDYLISLVLALIGLFLVDIFFPLSWLSYLLLLTIFTIVIYNLYISLSLYFSKGYTLFSFAFNARYCQIQDQKIRYSLCLIKSMLESLLIFPLIDLFYLAIKKTSRSLVDRVSDLILLIAKEY